MLEFPEFSFWVREVLVRGSEAMNVYALFDVVCIVQEK